MRVLDFPKASHLLDSERSPAANARIRLLDPAHRRRHSFGIVILFLDAHTPARSIWNALFAKRTFLWYRRLHRKSTPGSVGWGFLGQRTGPAKITLT